MIFVNGDTANRKIDYRKVQKRLNGGVGAARTKNYPKLTISTGCRAFQDSNYLICLSKYSQECCLESEVSNQTFSQLFIAFDSSAQLFRESGIDNVSICYV